MMTDTRTKRNVQDGSNLPLQQSFIDSGGRLIRRLNYNPSQYLITNSYGSYITSEIAVDEEYTRVHVEVIVSEFKE